MRRTLLHAFVGVAVLLATGCSAPAGEDPVEADALGSWFSTADGLIRRNSLSAPVSARIFAYLALAADAIYTPDQVLSVDFLPRALRPEAVLITDQDAAYAVAASLVLSDLVPVPSDTLRLEEMREEALEGCAERCGESASIGMAVARSVAAAHRADRYAALPYWGAWEPSDSPLSWRVTSTPPAPPVEPYWGALIPLTGGNVLEACRVPPPAEDIEASSRAVADLLSREDGDRAAAARFWDDPDGLTSGPAGHWVRIALQETSARSPWERADLLRSMTSAMHDTNIVVWEAKYRYNVPRPSTFGVRALITDPAHPEYPSAHAAVSTAAATILEHYGIAGFSDSTLGLERSFSGPREAAEEAGMSRVWAGIHREESKSEGSAAGRCVAEAMVAWS